MSTKVVSKNVFHLSLVLASVSLVFPGHLELMHIRLEGLERETLEYYKAGEFQT